MSIWFCPRSYYTCWLLTRAPAGVNIDPIYYFWDFETLLLKRLLKLTAHKVKKTQNRPMVCTTWVNSMLWNVSELHWNVSDLQLRTAVNSSYLFHCQHLYILYNVLYIFVCVLSGLMK